MTSSRDYKSESRREFDKVAPHYDKNSAFYYRITRWCDDAVIDRIGKMDAAFDRVLDVGCGTGVLLHSAFAILKSGSMVWICPIR